MSKQHRFEPEVLQTDNAGRVEELRALQKATEGHEYPWQTVEKLARQGARPGTRTWRSGRFSIRLGTRVPRNRDDSIPFGLPALFREQLRSPFEGDVDVGANILSPNPV